MTQDDTCDQEGEIDQGLGDGQDAETLVSGVDVGCFYLLEHRPGAGSGPKHQL